MKLSPKIEKFLGDKKIKYELLEHRVVYTGYDKAATLRLLPRAIAKTLVIKFNNEYGLVLIPADKLLCLVKTKKALNDWLKKQKRKPIKKLDFVKEAWMKKNLKGMAAGAIPPLGDIWQMPTFVEKSLIKTKKLVINGGDYNLSIKIDGKELKKLDGLLEAGFSKAKPKKPVAKKNKKKVFKKGPTKKILKTKPIRKNPNRRPKKRK